MAEIVVRVNTGMSTKPKYTILMHLEDGSDIFLSDEPDYIPAAEGIIIEKFFADPTVKRLEVIKMETIREFTREDGN